MAKEALSDNTVAFGRAVLLATDALDMSAEGAFWLFDRGDKEWRYFLITSLFGRIDPREVYLALNDALAKILSEPETEDFGLYIADPHEGFVASLLDQFETDRYVSEPVRKTVKIDGKRIKAVIYRLAPPLEESEAKRVQRRFRQSCRNLAAA